MARNCGGCGDVLPGLIWQGVEALFCPTCAAGLLPDQRAFFEAVERQWRRGHTFDRLEPAALVGGAALTSAGIAWFVPKAVPFTALPMAWFGGLAVVEIVRRRVARRLAGAISESRRLGMLGAGRPGYPALGGLSRGVAVALWLPVIPGGARGWRRATCVAVHGAAVKGELCIVPRKANEQIAVWFGGVDLRVGDAPFDEAFRVSAASEEVLRGALRSPVRDALLRLRERCAEFSIRKRDDRIEWTALGVVHPDLVNSALDALCALVTAGLGEKHERGTALRS